MKYLLLTIFFVFISANLQATDLNITNVIFNGNPTDPVKMKQYK